jgi:hypothetical protein
LADSVGRGEFKIAQTIIEQELGPVRATSMTVSAVEAYIAFMSGRLEHCREKVEQARQLASSADQASLFVRDYCDMLDAMMGADAASFNSIVSKLKRCEAQHVPKLVLFVPDPLPDGWLNPTLQ